MRKYWIILCGLLASAAIVFAADATAVKAVGPAIAHSAAAVDPDPEAERQLFIMANEDRAKIGLPPLQMDEGLTLAARQHATALASQRQLSHQFAGEAPLNLRLTSYTDLHLDRGGENVASAATVDQVHESLMLSPALRENLLSETYNVAGFGVVRRGHTLFVTQDFARAESRSSHH